jgi:3-oxoacyl-[acyl-carrier protein] reductase
VVITGGANGIGAVTAREAAKAGARVVVLDLDENAGKAVADEHVNITFRTLDVANHDEVLATVEQIVADHGRIDGLVCCAIVQPIVPVLELTPETLSAVFDVNVAGVVWMSKAVAPVMARQNSGSIVYFASGVVEIGKPNSTPYAASKGAVAGFARSFAKEIAPYGVRVNLCRPGIIDTPQYRAANPGADFSTLDRPEDAVGPVMFLLSDDATMTNSIVTREGTLPRTPKVFA